MTRPATGVRIVDLSHETLPADGWRFFAVPPRIRGLETFPVLAFALGDAAR